MRVQALCETIFKKSFKMRINNILLFVLTYVLYALDETHVGSLVKMEQVIM